MLRPSASIQPYPCVTPSGRSPTHSIRVEVASECPSSIPTKTYEVKEMPIETKPATILPYDSPVEDRPSHDPRSPTRFAPPVVQAWPWPNNQAAAPEPPFSVLLSARVGPSSASSSTLASNPLSPQLPILIDCKKPTTSVPRHELSSPRSPLSPLSPFHPDATSSSPRGGRVLQRSCYSTPNRVRTLNQSRVENNNHNSTTHEFARPPKPLHRGIKPMMHEECSPDEVLPPMLGMSHAPTSFVTVTKAPEQEVQCSEHQVLLVQLLELGGGSKILVQHLLNGGSFLRHFGAPRTPRSASRSSANAAVAPLPPTVPQPPALIHVWLSANLRLLYFTDLEKSETRARAGKPSKEFIPIDRIMSVVIGEPSRSPSSATRRLSNGGQPAQIQPPSAHHCFSIKTPTNSLDLECTSEKERDCWMSALQFLVDASRTNVSTDPETREDGIDTLLQSVYSMPASTVSVLPSTIGLMQALETLGNLNRQAQQASMLAASICSSPHAQQHAPTNSPVALASFSNSNSNSNASSVNSSAFSSPFISPAQSFRKMEDLEFVDDSCSSSMTLPPSESKLVNGSTVAETTWVQRRCSRSNLEPLSEKREEEEEEESDDEPCNSNESTRVMPQPSRTASDSMPIQLSIHSTLGSPVNSDGIENLSQLRTQVDSFEVELEHVSSDSQLPVLEAFASLPGLTVTNNTLDLPSRTRNTQIHESSIAPSPVAIIRSQSDPVISQSSLLMNQEMIMPPDILRLQRLLQREESDYERVTDWANRRFVHLQSHINSLMIERQKLLALVSQRQQQEETQWERDVDRVRGANVATPTVASPLLLPSEHALRRCQSDLL